MNRRAAAALGLLGFVLGGCGLKGGLYLPEKPGDVVVRPAATPTTPAESPTAEPPGTTAPPTPPPALDPPTGLNRG